MVCTICSYALIFCMTFSSCKEFWTCLFVCQLQYGKQEVYDGLITGAVKMGEHQRSHKRKFKGQLRMRTWKCICAAWSPSSSNVSSFDFWGQQSDHQATGQALSESFSNIPFEAEPLLLGIGINKWKAVQRGSFFLIGCVYMRRLLHGWLTVQ